MKTSIVLIVLIFFNTIMLLAKLLVGVNVWILVTAEVILLIGYFMKGHIQQKGKMYLNNLREIISVKRRRSA